MEISLEINQQSHTMQVEPGDSLLKVLRGMGLFGVKRGCEKGECGACTVMLNGEPVNSCMVLAVEADRAEVMTVEGLAHDGRLDKLQQKFVELTGTQCGFCTPGMLISAQALLTRHPHPTESQIREALIGNLCRCTGYTRIVDAVKEAAR